jgi:hypothetical protein
VKRDRSHYRLLQNDQISASEGNQSSITPFHQRPFGVNLIGHAFEVFGIGEDIRMAARALEAAGVPCCVLHHPAGNGAACTDRSLGPLLCNAGAGGGPYAFNLVCLAAPIQARWLLQTGIDPLRERYTLAAWPWETKQWPEAWNPLLDVVDGLWPSSQFTAQALHQPAQLAGKPLKVMPMAAEVPDPDRFCNPNSRLKTRHQHGLPEQAVLFGYGFDLNSTASRKNPMSVLEAFQLAFPQPHLPACFGLENNTHPLSEQVGLMIKSFPPNGFNPAWHWLQCRAAEDPRITLVAASLERDDLLALYGCCDVFLSLHRSEGFGRGMAEALQLGLDVIATDYGGNTDFCKGPLAHPVRCSEVRIPRNTYPWADNHCWGEPDLDHACQLMREVAEKRLKQQPNPTTLGDYRQSLSGAAAGARYRSALEELWNQRDQLQHQLRWRATTPIKPSNP